MVKKSKDYRSVLGQSWQLRREKRFLEAELVQHEALAEYPKGTVLFKPRGRFSWSIDQENRPLGLTSCVLPLG